MPSIPQSSTIAFALIVGFIVYVTVRGQLPQYLGVIGLGSQPIQSTSSSGSGLQNLIGNLPSLLS